jgi:hypothetical protein
MRFPVRGERVPCDCYFEQHLTMLRRVGATGHLAARVRMLAIFNSLLHQAAPRNVRPPLLFNGWASGAVGFSFSVKAERTPAPHVHSDHRQKEARRLESLSSRLFGENAMDLTPICSRCGKNMDLVVVIKPFGCQPGLIAYECPYCGHTHSRLTVQAG